jgi:Ca2+-transporting ATPase
MRNEHADSGLSRSFVLRRQEEEGYNELPTAKPKRLHQIFVGVATEPMVYLLLACGSIYFLIGDRQEASMLLGFLFLIVGITIFQEHKAERALETLRDLSSPRALVIREGRKQRIAGKEVVREDLILINEGDRVPADAVLIAANNLAADESLLTGESAPVDKRIDSNIFAGTTIVRGQALGIVTAIGANTELGKIGKSLQTSKREYTRLELHTTQLVKQVAWIAAAICLFVVITYAVHRNNWLEGSLVGLTLAMAILPNELPAVLTIFLALGAWRMSQRRVLTRKLPAIENLGSTTVLCVDKTGTLTLNQMSIQQMYSQGQFIDLFDSKLHSLPEEFHEALEFGILASQQDPFDPMELAFASAGVRYLRDTEHLHHDWALEKEYPISPELLSISHVWKPRLGGGFVIGAKGAPEAIIDLCHLNPAAAELMSKVSETMAQEGLRVLGIAKAQSNVASLPIHQHDFDFSFVGFIGIADPIRPEVPSAVSECRTAGIRLVMITGDHPATARSIAKKIGLEAPSRVVTGSELKNMSEMDLAKAVKEVQIFSRVSPAQKLQLVEALKAAGEIVAMTGDGVNDAPALKSAHIGIAMGRRGTDVARESASLVILDDDFGSIVEAIRMGRRVYTNLKSALIYLFAIHIPIAGMSVLPVVFDLPLVLLPAHIALLHLIIEPTSSVAFEVEPAAPTTMKTPPRNPHEPLFSRQLWLPCILQGASILIALIFVFLIALHRGQGEADARALVFTTLIVSNLMLIFMNRGSQLSLLKKITSTKNRVVEWIAESSIFLMGLVLYIPSLREIFRFSYLHPIDIGICLTIGIFSVLWLELLPKKRLKRLLSVHTPTN